MLTIIKVNSTSYSSLVIEKIYVFLLNRAVRTASSAAGVANAKPSPSSLSTPTPSLASSSSGASGGSSGGAIKLTDYGSAY